VGKMNLEGIPAITLKVFTLNPPKPPYLWGFINSVKTISINKFITFFTLQRITVPPYLA